MINAKLGLIIAAAIVVIVAAYFAVRPTTAPQTRQSPLIASPTIAEPPSPQYLHDHPAELQEAKTKCDGNTTPPEPYCTNVQKAEELVEADEYRKGAGGGAAPK